MTASRAFHPVAEIFPPLEGAEFAELAADIRRNGLIDPIVIHDGQVLDGRNRYRACIEADIEPRFTPFRGDDPVSYVVSRNLRRRHLDESQRAMVVAKLTTLRLGDNQHSEGVPIGRGSALLNVSERSVARAREVRKLGVPELVTAVEAGRVTVTAASEIATLPPDQQREVITLAKCDLVAVAKQIRAKEAESRRAERIARIAAVSTAEPLPQDRKYPVILADPPWRFEPYDRETGLDRAADTHYPTMTTADIKALKIPAADDAVLFLWATVPMLLDALSVMQAWGFDYVSNFVWVKDRVGTGFWLRNQHEHLLIGKRGDIPAPQRSSAPPSIISAPHREHSRKPDEAYLLIERMYPELPKIELFARGCREGWSAWGNEAVAS